MKNQSTLFLHLLLGIACAASADWNSFSQSYNLLTTVAGKGVLGGGGGNYWLPEFEGAAGQNVELSNPHMAMADSAGNIYIADKEAHAIRKVDPQGIIRTVAGTSTAGDGGNGIATGQPLNSPNGVWVSKKGDFYVLDLGNSKIRKVTADGMMTTIIHDTAEISLGRGLWVSANEDTIWYSSGSQIKRWTLQSGIVAYSTGFSGLGNIVQDRNGFIVATDRLANRVYRLDAQGQKTVIAGNGETTATIDGVKALENAFSGVRGVWFLDDNSYFLATHEGSQVWYIDTDGFSHLFLNGKEGDEHHSGDGEHYTTTGSKVSEVRAVTVDHQGNVIITENDRGFVRRVAKNNVAVFMHRSRAFKSTLMVYVKPGSGSINLTFTMEQAGDAAMRLIDRQGRVIDGERFINLHKGINSVDCKALCRSSGVYVVSLQMNGSAMAQSIMIFR